MSLFPSLTNSIRTFLAPHKGDQDALLGKSTRPVSEMRTSVKAKVREEILDRVEREPLNASQKSAVYHIFGPLLVLAGAGTGKTRVIVSRFAQLVGMGVPPRRILGVTFTNKAVKEMNDRTKALLGPYCTGRPTLKTLHGLCSNILRLHSGELGYNRHVEIASDYYREGFIKRSINAIDPVTGEQAMPWYALESMKGDAIKEVAAKISEWKNNLLDPDVAVQRCEEIEEMRALQVRSGSTSRPIENSYALARVYKHYEEILFRAGLIDCDDLLRHAVKIFKQNSKILESWQNRYDFILVDEYQDTNKAQYELLKLLADKHQNLCVVGDDDQSIYGWRAADVELIRKFPKDWEGCEVVKLEENYRCTQHILDLGNRLMENEIGRHIKKLFAFKKGGVKPQTKVFTDEHEEGEWIANDILIAKERDGSSYNGNAILVRDQYKMDPIAIGLQKANIPYQIWASDEIQMGEIKQNVYALLAVIHNPIEKDYALTPLLETSPLHLPDQDYKILTAAIDKGIVATYWEGLNSSKVMLKFSADGKKNAISLSRMVNRLHERAKSLKPGDSLSKITDDAIHSLYRAYTQEENWRRIRKPAPTLLMLQEISRYVESWEKTAKTLTLNSFLGWNTRIRLRAKEPQREQGDYVILATVHSVKGLEFKRVYVAACQENVLPTKRSIEKENNDDITGVNEERRLMYVAITRAKESLAFTWSRHRKVGRKKDVVHAPSRFLQESGASELYDQENLREKVKPKQKPLF